MAKKPNEETKATILALLEELRASEVYGRDNIDAIKADLKRLGYQAEKPSKRAEQRPTTAEAETR